MPDEEAAGEDLLRAEAAALVDDEADRAEAARVLRDMQTLRACMLPACGCDGRWHA